MKGAVGTKTGLIKMNKGNRQLYRRYKNKIDKLNNYWKQPSTFQ
jgi:hypothetical protein